jgi:hypothetical protein
MKHFYKVFLLAVCSSGFSTDVRHIHCVSVYGQRTIEITAKEKTSFEMKIKMAGNNLLFSQIPNIPHDQQDYELTLSTGYSPLTRAHTTFDKSDGFLFNWFSWEKNTPFQLKLTGLTDKKVYVVPISGWVVETSKTVKTFATGPRQFKTVNIKVFGRFLAKQEFHFEFDAKKDGDTGCYWEAP